MKRIWIFGGSFCTGYQTGGGSRDWIAQLDADVTVWATTPQSPQSQLQMVQHAFKCHALETRMLHRPDYILYDYPPANRVHLPTSIPDTEQTMLNNKKWANSRTGHQFECGCEADTSKHWSLRSLTTIDEWHKWRRTDPVHTEFVADTKRKFISGELPDQSTHEYTRQALDLIKASGIPYSWYSANNTSHKAFEEHQDRYLNIHTLNGNVPSQKYSSMTFNHLSIVQNIMWADYFNRKIC